MAFLINHNYNFSFFPILTIIRLFHTMSFFCSHIHPVIIATKMMITNSSGLLMITKMTIGSDMSIPIIIANVFILGCQSSSNLVILQVITCYLFFVELSFLTNLLLHFSMLCFLSLHLLHKCKNSKYSFPSTMSCRHTHFM